MKIKTIVSFGLAAALLAGCASEKCEDSEKHDQAKQVQLLAKAKVSQETAKETALAKIPGATVKEAELEKEKGRLIWSFDLTTPDSKNIMEVNVDAITGDVVGVETETPEDQAKEAAEDAGKAQDKDEDKN